MSSTASWLWVPIVLWAALAQTARNTAQRSLAARAGTLGATLVRFAYGLPFAAAWVLTLHWTLASSEPVPAFDAVFAGWLAIGALSQLAATACLLAAMQQRNFVIGVAYSRTDALQVTLFGALFLAEWPQAATLVAMALATAGVVLVSLPARVAATARTDWAGTAAAWGLASGAGFALSAVGYRGAALALPSTSPWLAGAWGVLWAQALQTLLLGGWLAWRAPAVLRMLASAWKVSVAAGATGAMASIGWFTAFALTAAANVRTLGLAEVLFSYVVSRRLLRETLSRRESLGLALVVAGLAALLAGR